MKNIIIISIFTLMVSCANKNKEEEKQVITAVAEDSLVYDPTVMLSYLKDKKATFPKSKLND